jgi:hypothetical protein
MHIRTILEAGLSIPSVLINLKPKMAQAAQRVYDEWDESDVDIYAGGGICHLISDAIVDLLSDNGIDAVSFSCSVGENHVMVACEVDDRTYIIDIPPHVYETGGGYSWQKIKGVEFRPNDISIDLAPENFDAYAEEF